jgi:hypothetical protein
LRVCRFHFSTTSKQEVVLFFARVLNFKPETGEPPAPAVAGSKNLSST